MIKNTTHGLSPFVCVSAVQKAIRRSDETLAFRFACEMIHTSKAYNTWMCNRLEVISHEDCDVMAVPFLVSLVATCVEQAKRFYKDLGGSDMYIGTAIRAMCRAPKSRETDHFILAVGYGVGVAGGPGDVPDYVFDMHTHRGRSLGRGTDHFRAEAAKLIQPAKVIPGTLVPTDYVAPASLGKPDKYEELAFLNMELWTQLEASKSSNPPKKKDDDSGNLF